ncbi:hypothetical protein ILP88_29985 [Mesorhizobium japonicum]|nr:hypothetical protein [Mesorhizobium japonicum]MBE1717968.1 hypothetical protein [Mesorhizobium japonicum]
MKKASNLLRSELWRNSYIGQLNEHFLGGTAPERARRLAVLGLEGLGDTFDQYTSPMQRKYANV